MNKNKILHLFTIIYFAIFYAFLPYAGDDWAWGSETGMERLKNAFDGYNGRYLGNLLIILITRSAIAKIILCSLIMFLLVFVLSKIFDNISKKDETTNYILAFSSVLLLVLPNQIAFGELQPFQIFGSTIGWLSGFTNYVVPSVLILVYYYFVTSKENAGKLMCTLLAFIGLLACLCVEHYTLFCLAFGFGVIAYRFYCSKKLCKKSISFLSGSVVGTLIMFSNSSYRLMQKGDISDNQRSVGFFGSLKNYAAFIFPKGTSKALIICFEIALLTIIAAVGILFLIKSCKALKSKRISQMLPVICMVVMTAPLLFTNSGKEIYIVAPRCYFLQYFMLVILIYGKLAKKNKINSKKFLEVLKLSFATLLVVTTAIYCRLDYIGIVRDRLVNDSLKNNTSTVQVIEYPKSVEHIQWSGNFMKTETYFERYKKFKKIPESKSVEIINYDLYKNR